MQILERINEPEHQATAASAALEVRDLEKHFGSTVALAGVSFAIEPGAVHALLGENGAGKSTLVKLLSGLIQPDSGSIHVLGSPRTIRGPRSAHDLGIRTAFQEISLVPDLTVAQNFFLMEEPLTWLGLASSRRSEEFAANELALLGLQTIDPRTRAGDLDLPTRQKIEIARSVSRKPRILLLDEPTASLSSEDVQWLARLIEGCKATGTTVVFISHRLQEVREFCTSFSVLRNGRCVGTSRVAGVGDEEIIEMMIGRSLEAVFPAKRPHDGAVATVPALSVESLCVATAVREVTFDLHFGEILGVSALQGMGQRELFLALFGAKRIEGGQIAVGGEPVALRSPAEAVGLGIGLVPEDRKTEGLFLDFDGRENLSLPALESFTRLGMVDQAREMREVLAACERVQVSPRALAEPASNSSGGNQQKMVIARWLVAGSRILLLYDPTRGVDVGTKAEIYRLIVDFAGRGGAVLFYSSEIGELVNLCSDVLVLYRGRISERLQDDAVSETRIMRAALREARPGSEVVR